MPWTSKHIDKWLKKSGTKIKTADGALAEVWELHHQPDKRILSEWARHFRNHYCRDTEIDDLRSGYDFSRAKYLAEIKFPDQSKAPGPSIRSGDFGEVLVSDFLQYVLEFWVPRTRYSDKTIRNESEKGSDVIGFKIVTEGNSSPADILAVFESKAQLTGPTTHQRLQDAVDHSEKDVARLPESLNAIKQRLRDKQAFADAKRVERFQNPVDRPYKEIFGAAVVLSTSTVDAKEIAKTDARNHPKRQNLSLIVIKGDDLMKLAHDLYKLAADEA